MNAMKELDIRPTARPAPGTRRSSSRGLQRLVLQEAGERKIRLELPKGFKKHRFQQPA
jgi:hypothetical protein